MSVSFDPPSGPPAQPPTSPDGFERRICARTGLALIKASGQLITRIAKSSYGPMNPMKRDPGEDPASWSRYDVAGHRTIYGGSPEASSYAESLALFRPAREEFDMADLFDDQGSTENLLSTVGDEWQALASWSPGMIPQQWRVDRVQYTLKLPKSGWFVDIEHGASVQAIHDGIGYSMPEITGGGGGRLTVAHLRGEDRSVTTAVASWVHSLVLDDGHRPHGLYYGSKHGSNWMCWAIWLRVVDDGDDPAKDVKREPTKVHSSCPIHPVEMNGPLREVASLFGLSCW